LKWKSDSAGEQQRKLPVHSRQACCCQRVRLIRMDKLKSFSRDQAAERARRPAAQAETRNPVHGDSSFRRAIGDGRISRR
jgi:hypothetical protein